MIRLLQFGVGEPDEILKMRRDKLVGVGYMQFELGSGRGIREGVGDLGEDSHVAETAGRFLEVVVIDGGAHLQAGRGGDGGFGEALAPD